MFKVSGTYYGHEFEGTVTTREPNWNDGGKGRGVHIYVSLDKPFEMYGQMRESLFLEGWRDGESFRWGSASVVSEGVAS